MAHNIYLDGYGAEQARKYALNQLAAAQQNTGMMNQAGLGLAYGYGDYTTGTSTNISPAGTAMSYDQYVRLMNLGSQQAAPEPKRKYKKSGNLLNDLRHEIDTWHGDVLRAA